MRRFAIAMRITNSLNMRYGLQIRNEQVYYCVRWVNNADENLE